jgi:nucleoside 2-deoxyribosyltransferase
MRKPLKQLHIYLAGPLFTEGEMNDRRQEADTLRTLGYEVYSPLEQNDEIGFDIDELYRRDLEAMKKANLAVICLDNYDSGTMAELGWFVAKKIPVCSIWTNWKWTEPDNLFIRGLALEGPNQLFSSHQELYDYLTMYRATIAKVE